jgi:CheY-like chemotaxis protein
LGYRVLEATDGPSALRLLDGGTRIDLLVTDVGLPGGMNGRQVAEAIRERMAGVPVLFITGYAGTALPPGTEVIGKPFRLDELAQRVQALLREEPMRGRGTDDAGDRPNHDPDQGDAAAAIVLLGSKPAQASVLDDQEQPI